jgi:hypothetical protein
LALRPGTFGLNIDQVATARSTRLKQSQIERSAGSKSGASCAALERKNRQLAMRQPLECRQAFGDEMERLLMER